MIRATTQGKQYYSSSNPPTASVVARQLNHPVKE
jgi:hypothetical protein